MTEDLGVSELLLQIQTYIKSLEDENKQLQKNIMLIKTENAKLLENERDMLKVSTIVNITNENIKLKNYISLLEGQLQNRFAEKNKFSVNEKNIEPIIDVSQAQPIEHPIAENQSSDLALNDNDNNIEPEKDNEEQEDENEVETLYKMKYKGVYYLYNEQNKVYECINDEKGEYVGIRKYIKKTDKYKVMFQD